MTNISYDSLCRSEVYNNVCAKSRAQVININQSKLKLNITYKKDEKLTTKFEAVDDEGNLNKAYLDKIIL